MATFKGSKATSGVQAKALHAGPVEVMSQYTGSATLSAGDVIEMVKVPKGARVLSYTVSTEMDDSSVSTGILNIGDGIDDDRYFSGTVTDGTAVSTMLHGGFGYEYSAEDTVDITVDGVGNDAAASAVLKLSVRYVLDDIDQSQF